MSIVNCEYIEYVLYQNNVQLTWPNIFSSMTSCNSPFDIKDVPSPHRLVHFLRILEVYPGPIFELKKIERCIIWLDAVQNCHDLQDMKIYSELFKSNLPLYVSGPQCKSTSCQFC